MYQSSELLGVFVVRSRIVGLREEGFKGGDERIGRRVWFFFQVDKEFGLTDVNMCDVLAIRLIPSASP